MDMIMTLIIHSVLLVAGLIALWFESKQVIIHAVHVAERHNISHFFVGFVLLALSSSLPEIFVTLQSIMCGTHMLAIGNAIGSNFNNICLAIGLPALLFGPISLHTVCTSQIVMLILGALAMGVVFFNPASFVIGALLCIAYVIGISSLYFFKRGCADDFDHRKNKVISKSKWPYVLLILSLLALLITSKLVVDSSIALVSLFNVKQGIFGSTILALGTVLPEITLNLHSVRVRNYALALGNSIGSVFAQSTLILGMLMMTAPDATSLFPLIMLVPFMIASLAIVLFHLITRRHITRLSGLLLLGLYVAYVVYAFAAGNA